MTSARCSWPDAHFLHPIQRDPVRKRIKQIMADAFEVPVSEIPDDASTENFAAWDSLGHMQLMLALEAEFGLSLSTEEMLELTSLDRVEALLRREGAQVAE